MNKTSRSFNRQSVANIAAQHELGTKLGLQTDTLTLHATRDVNESFGLLRKPLLFCSGGLDHKFGKRLVRCLERTRKSPGID